MLARVWSCALSGLEGELVQVEVDIHYGLPHTTIVGLPDAAVRESKDRLYAALRNVGFRYPAMRITVNLAPADVRKAGPAYDLPIALGILLASDQLKADLSDTIGIGEIALDGALRPTQGILPIAAAARARGFARVIVPAANASEAALVPGIEVVAAPDIVSLCLHLAGERRLPPAPPPDPGPGPEPGGPDLAHVRGQAHARRAIEIAAAGGHNLLLTGPPGSGKTLLARCMPSILPPLTPGEALDVTAIYSVAGALPTDVPLIRTPPFRSPHHTISNAGLIGGGPWPRPGEVSLAHHGVLFLDELPEFDLRSLESLRQPLEDRHVTIARASGAATFPASFMLVAARNPCPCGHSGDRARPCTCTPATITRYARRISGPLLDRIDLHVEVPRVEVHKLIDTQDAEGSGAVRDRVAAARDIQRGRLSAADPPAGPSDWRLKGRQARITCNGELTPDLIQAYCRLTADGRGLLQAGMRQLGLSARAYHRILKLARTIADLEACDAIQTSHLAEALQYRPRELV
jgi:magnesium chelatase family protein